MVKISNDYITSLIAMLQSVYLVDRIATTDYDATNESDFLIQSIYTKNTLDADKIYSQKSSLVDGCKLLKDILRGKNDISVLTMQKYALNIILIQKNINKISDLKNMIGKKIDNYHDNSMMATNLNDQIAYSEEIYKEYVGIIRPRVVISGKKEYLNKNSSLIRALLLSGIRAAFLWDYHGGSKWHLMFRRKEILNKCENYFI
jgi:high frequency lysogenization protein